MSTFVKAINKDLAKMPMLANWHGTALSKVADFILTEPKEETIDIFSMELNLNSKNRFHSLLFTHSVREILFLLKKEELEDKIFGDNLDKNIHLNREHEEKDNFDYESEMLTSQEMYHHPIYSKYCSWCILNTSHYQRNWLILKHKNIDNINDKSKEVEYSKSLIAIGVEIGSNLILSNTGRLNHDIRENRPADSYFSNCELDEILQNSNWRKELIVERERNNVYYSDFSHQLIEITHLSAREIREIYRTLKENYGFSFSNHSLGYLLENCNIQNFSKNLLQEITRRIISNDISLDTMIAFNKKVMELNNNMKQVVVSLIWKSINEVLLEGKSKDKRMLFSKWNKFFGKISISSSKNIFSYEPLKGSWNSLCEEITSMDKKIENRRNKVDTNTIIKSHNSLLVSFRNNSYESKTIKELRLRDLPHNILQDEDRMHYLLKNENNIDFTELNEGSLTMKVFNFYRVWPEWEKEILMLNKKLRENYFSCLNINLDEYFTKLDDVERNTLTPLIIKYFSANWNGIRSLIKGKMYGINMD